ncbi:SRPBCC domain-containing protein [Ramlibacter albus]|uniref:SRPBCC domain-containing protein n=1 Tax=Ramlibacter albus TaxID=2079448 RepID=A0A923M7A4_9BURK|nr:SRPBCC domain-containing protein [Ramlibacter albus]MBC5764680.1 SRPBCC domain-containing protein [Ramlibacter albus]
MGDPRDIVSTRVVPFTREQVFAAIADGKRCERWWGPAGFTNDFQVHEFREGGAWRHVMTGPDGKTYRNQSRFLEIVKPSRVVVEVNAPHFVLTMDLAEEGAGTRITWQQRFENAQVRDQFAPVCVPANEQNFDRLEAELRYHA